MSQRINRCSYCGCDEPIHNDIDGKLYCNVCGMSLENSSVTNRNRVSKNTPQSRLRAERGMYDENVHGC